MRLEQKLSHWALGTRFFILYSSGVDFVFLCLITVRLAIIQNVTKIVSKIADRTRFFLKKSVYIYT